MFHYTLPLWAVFVVPVMLRCNLTVECEVAADSRRLTTVSRVADSKTVQHALHSILCLAEQPEPHCLFFTDITLLRKLCSNPLSDNGYGTHIVLNIYVEVC